MPKAKHGAGNAPLAKKSQLMGEERFAGDGQQHLRDALGNWPQTGGEAAGEDGDGKAVRDGTAGTHSANAGKTWN